MALAREGITRYDSGDVEGALALFSPSIEVYAPPEQPSPGTFHGLEGFMRWSEDWNEAWERFEREIERVEAVGESHVVAVVMQRGVGRGSGVKVETPAGYLFEFDDERMCTYFALYLEPEQAFAAARERERIG